jgi:hypothetical protein
VNSPRHITVPFGLALTLFTSIAQATVVLDGLATVQVAARDQVVNSGTLISTHSISSLPESGSVERDAGEAHTQLGFQMSQSGFEFGFEGNSGGNPYGGDGGISGAILVRFTVDSSTSYTFSGDSTGDPGAGGLLYASFGASLLDTTNSISLFDSTQVSQYDAYYIESDGSPGGNNINSVTGSLTGTLQTGIIYELSGSSSHAAYHTPADTGAIVTSNWEMSFGGSQPVPTPDGLLILGLGLACLRFRMNQA